MTPQEERVISHLSHPKPSNMQEWLDVSPETSSELQELLEGPRGGHSLAAWGEGDLQISHISCHLCLGIIYF
jgi:hypothetical protein